MWLELARLVSSAIRLRQAGGWVWMLLLTLAFSAVQAGTPTTTSLAGFGSAQVNATITWDSVVSPSGPPAPTGTISVADGTGASCLITLPETACVMTNLTAGPKITTAIYSGDASYDGSPSGNAPYTVVKANTSLALNSSANPSGPGAPVTFTATVAELPSGPVNPSGTVSFYDGAILLGSETVSGNQATFTTSALSGGAHSITASYSGDASFTASTSTSLSQWVQITPAVSLGGFGLAQVNDTITWVATLTPAGPPAPTGTITVADGTGASCLITLPSTSCTLTNLSAGPKSATATYSGDGNYTLGLSAGIPYSVAKADTSLTLASSPNPAFFGGAVTFTATLVELPDGPASPTGTVSFYDGGILLGSETLSGNQATFTTSALGIGLHDITASYGGDTSFTGGSAAALPPGGAALIQSIEKLPSTTTVSTDPNPSGGRELVTLMATVTGSGPVPTGSVTFEVDGTILGSQALIGGAATFPMASLLKPGSREIRASYSGDDIYTESVSDAAIQVVEFPTIPLLPPFPMLLLTLGLAAAAQARLRKPSS